MIIDLIIIATIITIVWDFLGFPNEIASTIMSYLTHNKIREVTLRKPFGCSLCMTFWVGIIYCFIVYGGGILLTTLCCLIASISTPYIYCIIKLLDRLLINTFAFLERLINKI